MNYIIMEVDALIKITRESGFATQAPFSNSRTT